MSGLFLNLQLIQRTCSRQPEQHTLRPGRAALILSVTFLSEAHRINDESQLPMQEEFSSSIRTKKPWNNIILRPHTGHWRMISFPRYVLPLAARSLDNKFAQLHVVKYYMDIENANRPLSGASFAHHHVALSSIANWAAKPPQGFHP